MLKQIPVFFLLFLLSIPYSFADPNLQTKLDSLVKLSKSESLGISILDAETGQKIYEHSPDLPLKPASVLKLVTSATAFSTLGTEHFFSTEFLVDGDKNQRKVDASPNLYIRGGGDPSFTMESLWMVARKIKKQGIPVFRKIIFDSSLFLSARARQGQRAYETGSSAYPLNFNSLSIEICPSQHGNPARVVTDPWESGALISGSIKTIPGSVGIFSVDEILPHKKNIFAQYSVRGNIGERQDCEIVYRSVQDQEAYFGKVFIEILRMLGIEVLEGYASGKVPLRASPLFEQESKPLSLLVRDMNVFSNNMIAEQLLMALGKNSDGKFDREKGISALKNFLLGIGAPRHEYEILDGSGLSHDNRISPRVLAQSMQVSLRDPKYGAEYLASLPVLGKNGTLKERKATRGVFYRGKTGTLNGVSSLAGYMETAENKKWIFVIIQNGTRSKIDAQTTEDRIVALLYPS